MFEFKDGLHKCGLDLETTLVLRHVPVEPRLREVFPWLATSKPELFNAYQQTQNKRVEQQMFKATAVVSFFGHEPGKAVFIGVYDMKGAKAVSNKQRMQTEAYQKLVEFGMKKLVAYGNTQVFNLVEASHLSSLKGRLVVSWPRPEIVWARWAGFKNRFEVVALYDESILEKALPDWRELNLTWQQLQVMPPKLRAKLSEWRGVYFILDSSSGKGYVGSAYGKDNICGRWLNYQKTGHGNNKRLMECQPQNLVFSILERVSPDMPPDDVIQLEQTWKARLHTREHGLNEN